MITIGFVGASGTGKSFKAMSVAKANEADCLIDDGLFISAENGKVIAGTSAKREPTKLASVRRALFVQDTHAKSVSDAVKTQNPNKIMILGTSVQMVEKIAEVLKLPKLSKIIYIEDVSTQEEIKTAEKTRKEQGKHVIPVPTFEIKKDFSGYFTDTLKTFAGKGKKKTLISEKTVVRPTFSYMGSFHISEKALAAICKKAATDFSHDVRCTKAQVSSFGDNGVIMEMDIAVRLGLNISETAKKAQAEAKRKIEELTSVNVLLLNVNVKAVAEHV